MQNSALDKLIWVFIYAGMAIAGLGMWFLEHSAATGWTLVLGGAALFGVGLLLLWIRSRRN
jgi:cyanate permease